ncbi:MAG: hypothetical protein NTZ05_02430 [Chloroflexi bacterium]|nr:hypothetical protein [Chloroflexota bacterium]
MALLVVGVTGGLVLQGQPIPELWAAITGAVVGSYFTSYPAPERANNQKQEKSNG